MLRSVLVLFICCGGLSLAQVQDAEEGLLPDIKNQGELANTTCPPFEQWFQCANAECRAELCFQRGLSVACPSVLKCIPGCLCQENYLRDESGVCVLEENCPSNEA